jgi:hypothetical protein
VLKTRSAQEVTTIRIVRMLAGVIMATAACSQDFGARAKAECESAYQQIARIDAAMSDEERRVEDAGRERALAQVSPRDPVQAAETKVRDDEATRLRWVKACIAARARRGLSQ